MGGIGPSEPPLAVAWRYTHSAASLDLGDVGRYLSSKRLKTPRGRKRQGATGLLRALACPFVSMCGDSPNKCSLGSMVGCRWAWWLCFLPDQPNEYSFSQNFPVAEPQSAGRQRVGHRPAQMLVWLVIWATEPCLGWMWPPEGLSLGHAASSVGPSALCRRDAFLYLS